ncbi:hypothetical protein [Streptomonospora salina]|uniref:Zinc-finger domain-containing protein n=1 Tax=Streptomonospora salina TaxID=104205 RepID=A0A841E780_9ACTN|nr:hypothetical protein [Streptomonospora salina]MBB5998702.1 hypothetical protein [Streptomonospora salina]
MTSHVDAETLALSAEGLLQDNEENAVQQHVADCATCAAQQSELADVPQVLAEVSAPPLPDSVSERLDDALRAEADNRSPYGDTGDAGAGGGTAASGGAGSEPPGDVVPMRRRFGSSHRWINYLAVAAAAVVVVGGGSAIVRNVVLGPEFGGQFSDTGGAAGSTAHDTARDYQPLVVESGTVYTAARLDDQAATVLDESDPTAADSPGGSESAPEGAAGGAPGDRSDAPPDVSSCVESAADSSGDRPLLIDLAEYSSDGAEGTAWVMYYGSRPGGRAQDTYDVVVFAPECGSEGTAAHEDAVLERTTVKAP